MSQYSCKLLRHKVIGKEVFLINERKSASMSVMLSTRKGKFANLRYRENWDTCDFGYEANNTDKRGQETNPGDEMARYYNHPHHHHD